MTTKLVHLYDAVTGEYVGNYNAQEDPLELGKFIEPIYSTDLPLPTLLVNQAAVFSSGAWVVAPDYRGQIIYNQADGTSQEVTEIGTIPAGYALTPPPKTPQQLIAEVEGWAQSHLDSLATSAGYDSAIACISYINSTNTTWKADATALNAYRDSMWAYLHGQEPNYANGTATFPADQATFVTALQAAVTDPTLNNKPV